MNGPDALLGLQGILEVAAAALGGAAIGVEREWSGHASGQHARFGGVRTFTLLGGLAGISARLWIEGQPFPGAILLAAAAALVLAGYVAASRRDVEATTEVAALVVLAAGVLAGSGRFALASAVIAVTDLLLVEKSSLHSMVGRLDDVELRAGARFAVMSSVILPLLPTGPFGPFGGIRPRAIWTLVLLLSGLSFTGYIARRAMGRGRGDTVAGLLGGLVSSTSVALGFSRASRAPGAAAGPLANGVVGASSVMFARIILVTWALAPLLGRRVGILLAAPLAIGTALTLLGLAGGSGGEVAPAEESENPLQLRAAVQMALLFQAVLLGIDWVRGVFGDAGLLVSAALLGLADTDALSISMASTVAQGADPGVAALAVAVGAISNTVVKLGIVLGIGSGGFRLRAGLGLGVLGLAAAAAAWLLGTVR
ncbi:MAG: MgtC/SapB family protein [Alphaproteobacteria bacterium]